ncbi:hypothetical protein CGZ90_14210 [Fictibacillus aquaticus]|uniref:Uncharacterized protein n=1 Tax=Fictibacillus aquaticus TaxID=2021314 RepID=A0A235F7N0_9BACL|nr:hypothetical protein CGZ90_14210 [Fictibacillus aquaticus]
MLNQGCLRVFDEFLLYKCVLVYGCVLTNCGWFFGLVLAYIFFDANMGSGTGMVLVLGLGFGYHFYRSKRWFGSLALFWLTFSLMLTWGPVPGWFWFLGLDLVIIFIEAKDDLVLWPCFGEHLLRC